ncbi:MAG TPA: DMT family transporter [Steroidobacter sp.]|nr:DMT family transporter [Steroidobacter sp.]
MRTNEVGGVFSMLGAVFFFSMMDASLKELSSTYGPMQVAFFRGVAGLPVVIAMTLLRKHWRELKPVRWRLHLLRGLLSVLTLYTFVFALSELSLADAYSIFLAAPLIVTGLSAPMLKEQVSWNRWAAIAVGLTGAVIMLRPSGAHLAAWGAVAALAAAAMYALSVVLIRIASRTDTAAATVFWTLLVLTIVSGALSVRSWVALQQDDWMWIGLIGVTGACGQLLLTEAFRRCEASVVAPLEYSALLWGVVLDWVIWQALPTQRMLLGSAIVVGSGLYVLWRERRLAQNA